MSNKPSWYKSITVTRSRSRHSDENALITVHAPHAYGRVRSCQVRSSDTNGFMADIIEGLLHEISIKDAKIEELSRD